MKITSLILMTTYNGEKYLKQQIESILNQSYQDWVLLISDDGSTDNTISILKNFEKRDNRIIVTVNDTQRHGAYVNFWFLIEKAKNLGKYSYYFFADQDDIWPIDRMKWMIESAEKEDDIPLFLYGDMKIIDGDGKQIYESLNKIMGIGNMSGLTEFYSSGFVWGCDSMINYALFSKTPIYPTDDPYVEIMSHDNYYAKYAITIGKIKYIDKICIEHRRHGSNTTGSLQMKLSLINVAKKVILGFNELAKTHALGYIQTLKTIEIMKKNQQDCPDVINVEKAIKKGGFSAVFTMIRQKVRRKQFPRTLGIYIIMLLKTYQKYIDDSKLR